VSKLLCKDPDTRLGSQLDALEVLEHNFFAGFDFEAIKRKETKAPFEPYKLSFDLNKL
jgi:serum/glucocorticoid-regulated kinase 2